MAMVAVSSKEKNIIMKNRISKEEWVAMFEAIGLEKPKMHRWHQLFESRHPEAHQSFLEWLGIEADTIRQIRKNSH
jgi:hypothetical protein